MTGKVILANNVNIATVRRKSRDLVYMLCLLSLPVSWWFQSRILSTKLEGQRFRPDRRKSGRTWSAVPWSLNVNLAHKAGNDDFPKRRFRRALMNRLTV